MSEQDELAVWISDSAIPVGGTYVIRADVAAEAVLAAGYHKSERFDAVLRLLERAEMHGNHLIYANELRDAITEESE